MNLGATTQPTSFGSLNPDIVRVVGGRLFFLDGTNIAEVNSSGAKVSSSLDSTIPQAGGSWVTVCSGPVGFYAAGNAADTGFVSFVAVGAADGLLEEPQQVAELPRGENGLFGLVVVQAKCIEPICQSLLNHWFLRGLLTLFL